MAGADEPATLSGLCQPMAIAMVKKVVVVNPGLRLENARIVRSGAMEEGGSINAGFCGFPSTVKTVCSG
jgi:hypothetical protein